MSKKTLERLPFELVHKISSYLAFSDIWYLGTCSRKSKTLAFKILKSKYQIDSLDTPNPFSNFIYGAIAYMDRYGHEHSKIKLTVLQSVANHLAMVIYDRLPVTKSSQLFSYDFFLNETISILIHNALSDPTLRSLKNPKDEGIRDPKSYSRQIHQLSAELQQKLRHDNQANTNDPYATQSTGVLTIDFLIILFTTLDALFDNTSQLFHRFLILHLSRLFYKTKQQYQQYHTHLPQPICMDQATRDFQLFFRFFCVFIQTDLCTSQDIDDFTSIHLGPFFITKPSDVSFSATKGLAIRLHSTPDPSPVTIHSTAFQYQWRLWLKETQLRMTLLLIILQSLIQKCYGSNEPLEFRHVGNMLQDTVTALSWTESESPKDLRHVQVSYLE
ncbi:hypothetical protein BD560DRAFT_381121 [Blakeslea trispora]|nr:hypothetical protein BD560DRAFT_381121 [Blakeslea trispora]